MSITGNIIYRNRKRKKLSRPALSKISGVSRNTIQRYETSPELPNMTIKTLARLIDALDLSLDEVDQIVVECGLDNITGDNISFEFTAFSKMTPRQRRILYKTNNLNRYGQRKTEEYIDDLLEINKYLKREE